MAKDMSASGDSSDSSGAGTGNDTDNETLGAVPKSHVDKILREKKNLSLKMSELQSELDNLKESKLQEQNQYKELAEMRLQKLKELETFKTETTEKLEKAKKISAVSTQLKALGLKSEHEDIALNKLLDISRLVTDPDTGVVLGAEELAKDFRKQYASLGLFGKPVAGVNHDAPIHANEKNSTSNPYSKMNATELLDEFKRLRSNG